MKKFSLFLQVVIMIFFCSAASAQKTVPAPEPYWVIESNVKTPTHSIVCFYSTNHELMYKRTVDGKRLNVNHPKIRRMLNEALKEVTLAWKEGKLTEKSELVAMQRF
jgi:hypothetical protein